MLWCFISKALLGKLHASAFPSRALLVVAIRVLCQPDAAMRHLAYAVVHPSREAREVCVVYAPGEQGDAALHVLHTDQASPGVERGERAVEGDVNVVLVELGAPRRRASGRRRVFGAVEQEPRAVSVGCGVHAHALCDVARHEYEETGLPQHPHQRRLAGVLLQIAHPQRRWYVLGGAGDGGAEVAKGVAAVCQSEIHDAREWHGMGEQHSSAGLVAGLA